MTHFKQWTSYEQGVEVLESRGVESQKARVQAGRLRPDLHRAWLADQNRKADPATLKAIREGRRSVHPAVERQADPKAKAATTKSAPVKPKATAAPVKAIASEPVKPTTSPAGSNCYANLSDEDRKAKLDELRGHYNKRGLVGLELRKVLVREHPGLDPAAEREVAVWEGRA